MRAIQAEFLSKSPRFPDVTLVQGDNPESKRRDLLAIRSSPIPQNFVDQFNSLDSPLHMDSSAPNMFMNMRNSASGLESYATAVGLRSRDMYGTCVALFLAIAAGIIGFSLLFWIGHAIVDVLFLSGSSRQSNNNNPAIHLAATTTGTAQSRKSMGGGHRASESYSYSEYDMSLGKKSGVESVPPTPGASSALNFGAGIASSGPSQATRQTKWKKGWAKFKLKGPMGAFHFAALCGEFRAILKPVTDDTNSTYLSQATSSVS